MSSDTGSSHSASESIFKQSSLDVLSRQTSHSYRALGNRSLVTPYAKCRKATSVKQKQTKEMVQTTLQLGQRQPRSQKCKECEMEYSIGSAEDDQLHKAYHRQYMDGIRWQVSLPSLFIGLDRSFIIHIHSSEHPKEWCKFLNLVSIVDKELGAIPSDIPKTGTGQGFVCLTPDGRVKGCVLAEPIHYAHESISDTTYSDERVDAICGISRIWVSKLDRRQGIATRLLDAVRHRFILGQVLPHQLLALSQPSSAGRLLANHYFGNPFRVYLIE
ncbi:hypothetical protein BDV3_002879 [Batrachochytrium dendrobatidis]